MYIVDYQRMNVVNMDNISNLSLEGRQIVAYDSGGYRHQLGIYDNKRAIEIFTDILEKRFPPDEEVRQGTYYMPEK